MKKLPVNETPNLVVIVEGTSLHHELPFHDPAGLRQRIVNLIENLRNSPTLRNTDVNSLEETIECLDAAREELDTLSDERLVKVIEKCIGSTMPPEIKKFIADKRSKALTTIIQEGGVKVSNLQCGRARSHNLAGENPVPEGRPATG